MKVHDTRFVKSAAKWHQAPDWDLREVAFAGRSNVGKSSLINSLINRRNLVKTSKKPGHTQLINFFESTIEPPGREVSSLGLVDLPGYGFARVPKSVKREWGGMIEAYLKHRQQLQALVILMDIRRGMKEDDKQLLDALAHFGPQPILVFTKADKLSRNKRMTERRKLAKTLGCPDKEILFYSSLDGLGREKLWKRIVEMCLPAVDTEFMEAEAAEGDDESAPSTGELAQPESADETA